MMTGPQRETNATKRRRRTSSTLSAHPDLDNTDRLSLCRTTSPEPAAVESIVVPQISRESKPASVTSSSSDDVAKWPSHTKYLVLFCSFITSVSFGVTQVPMLYVFRLMTCDAYYETHPSQSPPLDETSDSFSMSAFSVMAGTAAYRPQATDRCSIRAIESSTALSISLLGASTTVFGLLNLFGTGVLIKRIGVKRTLILNIFFPALRLLVQNIGVEVWGNAGIIIVQCSQILTVFGGPSGYMLVLNTFITEVVDYEGRTAALGRLTGAMMFGSAVGFLVGGIVAETFGIKTPFRLTFILFLSSCAYVALALPYIPPAEKEEGADDKPRKSFLRQFFGPLAVFGPRKFVNEVGHVTTEYGAFLLAWGVFLGILATGYLPTLLQLYATDVFAFGTKKNGWLIFMYSMLRGVFLTFAFPKLIAVGRRWTLKREDDRRKSQTDTDEREPLLIRSPDGRDDSQLREQPKQQTFTFDLTYTRFSLIADGCLTLLCTFIRQGWQMYLVAAVLPFAAGTSSAAKGTILQMVGNSATSSERTDALAGISLVENMARLSTTFLLGVIFAAFASIGRTELVFTCNAAIAIVGFLVLVFARFPPKGSRKLDE